MRLPHRGGVQGWCISIALRGFKIMECFKIDCLVLSLLKTFYFQVITLAIWLFQVKMEELEKSAQVDVLRSGNIEGTVHLLAAMTLDLQFR